MNRWSRAAAGGLSLWAALAAPVLTSLPATAAAQGIVREVPADVRPGMLGVTLPPDITLDGTAARLSPGARIRDTNNMLVMSASLSGRSVPVVFRRDAAGLVHEVWILTPAEYERLGGAGAADGSGLQRFIELLNLIFAARAVKGS